MNRCGGGMYGGIIGIPIGIPIGGAMPGYPMDIMGGGMPRPGAFIAYGGAPAIPGHGPPCGKGGGGGPPPGPPGYMDYMEDV